MSARTSLKRLPLPFRLKNEPYRFWPSSKRRTRSLHNRYLGQSCVIIGNGPSLNLTDLNLLTDVFSIGVNSIFLKTDELGFVPTCYVVEDRHLLNDNLERVRSFRAPLRFFPSHYRSALGDRPEWSKSSDHFLNVDRGFYEKNSPDFRAPRFSKDISKRVYLGQSVTIMNLQIAYYLGFSRVYLVGMDFSYSIPDSAIRNGLTIESTEDDNNHFHPDYFGAGKKWHDPQLDMVSLNYELARLVFESDGRKILNATVGGALEVFERVDIQDIFRFAPFKESNNCA
jgi:hypothetical protein